MPVGDYIGDLIPDLVGDGLPFGGGPEAALVSALGANLVHFWRAVPSADSRIVLNSGRVSRLYDWRETDFVTPNYAYLDQATAGNQPLFVASGGPGGALPYISIDGTTRYLLASITERPANNRTGFYNICIPDTNAAADRYSSSLSHATGPVLVSLHYSRNSATPHGRKTYIDFNAGTDWNGTNEDYASGWQTAAIRPLSTGATVDYDGVAATTQPSNTNGLVALNRVSMGYNAAATGGGSQFAVILTEEPVTAIDDAVLAYAAAIGV